MKSSATTKLSKAAKAVQHLTAQYKGVGLQAAAQQEANRLAKSGGILYKEYAISIQEVSLTTGTAAISLQIQVSLTAGICQMDKSFHGVLMLEDLPDGTAEEMELPITTYISREIDRVSNWVILRLGLPPVLWDKAGPSPDHISLAQSASAEIHRLIGEHWTGVYAQHNAWFAAAIRRDLAERQQPYRDILPAWANIALKSVQCTCRLVSAGTEKDIRLVLHLRVRLTLVGYREKEASVSLLPMVRIDPSQWSPFLWSAIQSCADELLKGIPGWLPLWAQAPGAISGAVRALYSGPVVRGCVSVLWQGTWLSNKSQIIRLGGTPINIPDVYLLTDLSGSPIPDSALPYRKISGKTDLAQVWTEPPYNAVLLERLANSLDSRLKERTPKGQKPPKAVILMSPNKPPQIRFGRQAIPLSKPADKSLKQYLQSLTDQILQEHAAIAALPDLQKKVFQGLNPTELFLLRILRTGKTIRVEDLRDLLEDSGMITTVKFAVQCLDGLTEKTIPTAEALSAPLVRGLDLKGTHWQAYTAGAYFSPEVLRHVVPRNYSLQELSGIRPSSRAAWAEDWLLRAQSPSLRGPAFVEASKNLPRTFLAQFVRTEMGQDFLRMMAPKDIPQTKEILQSLPGCRKLAETLWVAQVEGEAVGQ